MPNQLLLLQLTSQFSKIILTISGLNYENIHVTHNGYVLAKFGQEDAVKAACIQFSALYNFDANYEVTKDGKATPEIRNFFDFVTIFFWGIRIKHVSKGTGITLKKKVISNPVQSLWKAICDAKEN